MRVIFSSLLVLAALASPALAVKCGNTGAGFETWKETFSQQAREAGMSQKALTALAGTKYATATIKADRNQKSFKLGLDAFMQKRGAGAIVAQGRKLKKSNAALFAKIEKKYGVPPGPLLAIWGIETNYGTTAGAHNVLAALATLAHADPRRATFWRGELIAALRVIEYAQVSAILLTILACVVVVDGLGAWLREKLK